MISFDKLYDGLNVVHDQLNNTVVELTNMGATADAAAVAEFRAQAFRMMNMLISMSHLMEADWKNLNAAIEAALPRLKQLEAIRDAASPAMKAEEKPEENKQVPVASQRGQTASVVILDEFPYAEMQEDSQTTAPHPV